MNPEITAKLAQEKIEVKSYDGFVNYIKNLPSDSRVWLDVDSANLAMYHAIPTKASKVEKPLPINMLKACKNDTEIAGARACHIQDGAAEVRWLHWLSTEIMCDESIYRHQTEVTLAEKLEDFRKEGKNFKDCLSVVYRPLALMPLSFTIMPVPRLVLRLTQRRSTS